MTLVWVETAGGAVTETSLEALSFARGLGAPVYAVLVEAGDGAGATSRLGEYGVERVLRVGGEAFEAYAAAAWAGAVVAATRSLASESVVLAAGTPRGNEVMAHVACRLEVAMAANVVAVDGQSPLTVSRQVLGGSVLEQMQLPDEIAVLTVAGHAVEAQPASAPTTPEAVDLPVDVRQEDLRARVARTENREPDLSGGLKTAKVVVGAGRGAGSAEGFGDLLELAELLDASLGVSRVVTSLGWRPHHEQVGQTGSRIAPDLYIPCGISGAIQHWAGCSSANTILAVNTDPDAPMVTRAHYAVIGDLHEIVPAVNEEIKRRRAG
ncbi:MAG TPA: electron transfer flavoprotein subunit alpha/FixB family protein [Nocardioidaceae bacterium]|nr:electron transfer flavoprotein subunit alpha/FixB family protein [Nocardioidaceae bacterium]